MLTPPQAPDNLLAETTAFVPAAEEALPLEDRLPEWFRTRPRVACYAGVLGVLFFALSLVPLWHTDVWGHLAYGRYLWFARSLPATEPLLPLSQGMPFVDTAWLSQLIGFGVATKWGLPGLQFLYAAPIALCCGLLVARINRRTDSVLFSLLGMVTFLATSYQQIIVVRPEFTGLVCLVGLLFLLTQRPWPRAGWVIVPAMFALWVNLHGSFVVGLFLVGAFLAGRAIDVVRRTGSVRRALRDGAVRRWFVLLELAFLATLINPYGLGLYAEVLTFSQNPNLKDLFDWLPLSLAMKQGQVAAVVAATLAILYRFSPRRISATEPILLCGLGLGALWSSRMISWWSPVAAYYLALNAAAVFRSTFSRWFPPKPVVPRSYWTVMAGGMLGLAVLFSPFGQRLAHGKKVEGRAKLSPFTPVAATEYLHRNPPKGLVYNSYELGDYLLWAGPPGMQVFVNSHAHLIPRDIWEQHNQISSVSSGWEDLLDLLGVNTMVLSREDDRKLIGTARRNENWKVGFEDDTTVVLVRKKPI